MRQVSVSSYIIAAINICTLTSLSFSLSTEAINTKTKRLYYWENASAMSSEDCYKAETLETPSVNVKHLRIESYTVSTVRLFTVLNNSAF